MLDRVGTIRILHSMGFKEKHIRMITGENQSYVNKIIRGNLHRFTDTSSVQLKPEILEKVEAVKKILEVPVLFTADVEQEIKYVKILRMFLVEKEQIYKLYDYMSKAKINRWLSKKDVEIVLFDSKLLGIRPEIFLDLIVNFV